jgi:hypothetical protein
MAKNLRCARQPAQHTRFEPDRSHGGALHARILVSPAALLARQGATRDGILLDGTAPHRAHGHMQHAHRRYAQYCHARRHHARRHYARRLLGRAVDLCAGSHRPCHSEAAGRQADSRSRAPDAPRPPWTRGRLFVTEPRALCREQGHVSRHEPRPCHCGVWPMCAASSPRHCLCDSLASLRN